MIPVVGEAKTVLRAELTLAYTPGTNRFPVLPQISHRI